MRKFFKRLFCKHKKKIYSRTFLDDVIPGHFRTHHIWKCADCGKEFW